MHDVFQTPMLPIYNALDREKSSTALNNDIAEKSKKFPFCKEDIRTTEG